jgi:CubicO group peptidase (beta-lactamase class C family)
MRLCVRFAVAMAGSAIVALTAGAGGAVPRPYRSLEPHPSAPHKAVVHTAAVAPKPAVNVAAAAAPPAARPIVRPAAPTAHAAEAPAAIAPPTNGARLAPGAPIPPAELEAFVDGAVRQAMATDHVAGVEIAVVQSGQVVLKKGYGFAGPGRVVDPDNTLFRLGSISKTFTWIAVMKDAEAGRIRLNTPINLYLPESLQVKDQGFKRPILVRDLMTHTSGFADRALGQLFEDDPRRVRPLTVYLRQERPRRVREPGLIASYSNYGAALAGQASSWVNGKPFADLIEGEITGPLGMAHTTFREPYPARADLPAPMPAALAGQAATGYRWAGGALQPQPFEYVSQIAPAGAVSSTAGDMARYMMMILGGGQLDGATIYGPGTAQGFRTTLQSSAPGMNGFDNGFMETALPGGFHGQGHGGDTLWFHSNMLVVPDLNLGVFVTTNTDTGPRLVHTLPAEIVGRFYAPPPPQPPAGSPELADQHSVYDGVYLTARRPYNGLEQFIFLLIGEARVHVQRDGRMLIARAGEADLWTPAGPPGHFVAADGVQTSAFQIQNGRASRWFDPSGAVTFERIGALRQIPTLVIAALIAAIAAIATLVGLFTRDRRESRETPMQARASQVQTATAILFLLAIVLTGLFAARAGDMAYVMFAWPTPYLLIASACALVAAVLSFLTLGMAPTVWRGGRRVESWTSWRKLRFTVTTLIFASFSVLLALWGALEPWSG